MKLTDDVHGFTLLELMLAIFIFSIVLSSVYGAYSATFKVFSHAEFETEMHEKARIALTRISEDVKNVYVSGGIGLTGGRQEIDSRHGDSMELLSQSHLTFDRRLKEGSSGIIRYTVERDEDTNLFHLFRADTLHLPKRDVDPDEKGFLLSDQLWEVKFTYLDENGEESDEWTGGGGSQGQTNPQKPVMVTITLVFANQTGDGPGTRFTTAVALGRVEP